MNIYELLHGAQERGMQDNRIYGVVVAVVTNNEDKSGQGRVKVRFPWLSAEDEGNWARTLSPMTGNGWGFYALPEVNEEVVVAFEQGDIRLPYVVGALWNGKDTPPATNDDGKNNLRLIRSRSGHSIEFNDEDGKETLSIVDMSTDNRITFDSAENTITVEAAQDLTLSAPKGKIKLVAQEIEIVSSDGAKIEAGKGLDVKSDATLNIKGSTVNIN